MKDEEFVKLRFWLDAELTIIRIFLAIVIGLLLHSTWIHVVIALYIILSLGYASARIRYVESKHKGYTRIPKW